MKFEISDFATRRALTLYCAAIICATLFWAARCSAFVLSVDADTGAPLHWPVEGTAPRRMEPIPFFVVDETWSTTNRAAELNAIRAAFGQRQSIPGTLLRFEEGGVLRARPDMIDPTDGTNIVRWINTRGLINGGTVSLAGILGLTLTSYRADGTMLGADIVLNGTEFEWFTDFNDRNNPAFFAETTLLHEIGHLLGLDHSPAGASLMHPRGGTGIDARFGIGADEIAFARASYGASGTGADLAHLAGKVTMRGSGVFGAAVSVEDSAGNLLATTVSGAGGAFVFNALPPGAHGVRAWPLDSVWASDWLVRGCDLNDRFFRCATAFLPTTNFPVMLAAGATNRFDIAVIEGEPAFRITDIREPSGMSASTSLSPLGVTLAPGRSNVIIGVFSANLPLVGARLRITGDGLAVGPTIPQATTVFSDGRVLNGLLASVSVATNATPGLRSFVVEQGTNRAYANGYLKILPRVPDYNFDGLDDTFQRRFFPVFTASEAAPATDADGDGISNADEFLAGTDPTDRASRFGIERVTQTAAGTLVEWSSAPGRRYQVFSKLSLGTSPWRAVGAPVKASGTMSAFQDAAAATGGIRFYRVQALP